MKGEKTGYIQLIESIEKAKEDGTSHFECPVCGGDVELFQSEYNGHVRAVCHKCGLKVIE